MEEKLQFLRFEMNRLDIVYENIPLSVETYRLIGEQKQQISQISEGRFKEELNGLIVRWRAMKDACDDISRDQMLRSIRDLLIFGEKINKVTNNTIVERELFTLNRSVLDNTILLILELHSEKGHFEKEELKNFYEKRHFVEDIEYLIEGVIHEESRGIPNSLKGVIEGLIPLDIQIMFKYHYQVKERCVGRLGNHFIQMSPLIQLFSMTYTQLSYQMKYILLKKTRKALPIRSIFNECFSDILRVIIVEFVEFITLHAQKNPLQFTPPQQSENQMIPSENSLITSKLTTKENTIPSNENPSIMNESQPNENVILNKENPLITSELNPNENVILNKENQLNKNELKPSENLLPISHQQLALSFVMLLSEIKQTEAFISVMNILRQVAIRHPENPSLKDFDALANFFVNIKVKTNEERRSDRLKDLNAFLLRVDIFCSFLQPSSDSLFFYNPELLFVRASKLFDDKQSSFTELDEEELDKLFTAITSHVDVKKYNTLISKNSDIPQNILTNFNFNSYGNKVFTRIIFFLLQKPFDLKMKKQLIESVRVRWDEI